MIRLGIAGLAHQHVTYIFDELTHQPSVRLVAVSDPDQANIARYASSIADCPVYPDHQAMLAAHELDVVVVNGIYAHRADAVVDALRAGADVLADKPLCTSLDQLDTIERVAAETGRLVSVMFEKRGYPVTLAARELVESGTLGDLALIASTGPHVLRAATRPAWFFTSDYGGILGDLAVHDVDMVLALTGATDGLVVGSSGQRAYPEYPRFSDHGAMMFVAGGVRATIDAHWLAPEAEKGNGRYEMRLVGTRGTAELRWTEGRLDVATHDRDLWNPALPTRRRPAEDFLTALLTGSQPDVGTRESVDATRIALLAQLSADRGGTVERWSAAAE
ncbi:Gfo/Idh/MocA family protein [Phytoactinopolyspora limicola]|uniref:Gfo/Idh/MocA family protein n=1 Tax=Phytoactinopolyspora limicola TaxID=2715536 RepID=UPI00140DCF0F|nr:Gfo/Idh/MocA family oxidoreductase [Phytoactinopolyspora limicola]